MPTKHNQLAGQAAGVDVDRLNATAELSNTSRELRPDEIDAASLVAEFMNTSTPLPSNSEFHGFDEHVSEIPLSDRRRVETLPCPVCGGMRAVPLFAVDQTPYRVVVCDGCGLGQLFPMPTPAEIAAFYPADYYGAAGAKFKPLVEAMVRIVGARHVRSLARGLRHGARILDVGCGRGVLLAELADRGFEAHGFEISDTAAAGADPRAQIRIADDLALARYPDGFFDEVIVWHVLEHLANPRETLLEIRRILRPGGRLAVSVPNFSSLQARWAGAAWFQLDLPRHLFHFPLPALRQLMDGCGFDCVSEHHFSLRQNPFGWVQSWLNRRSQLPRNGLYRLLKRANSGNSALFDRTTRFKLLAAYYLGMPPAIVGSIAAAALRSGATVCVMAKSRP